MPTPTVNNVGSILLYPDDGPFGNNDILLTDDVWEHDFQRDVANGTLIKPLKCFVTSTSSLERYSYTLRKYLGYSYGRAVKARATPEDIGQALFFYHWEELIAELRWIPNSTAKILNRPCEDTNSFFPQFGSLFRLLCGFVEKVGLPLLDCSPFCDRDLASKSALWVSEKVNALQGLRDFVAQWERFRVAQSIPAGTNLEDLVVFARRQISAWEQFQKTVPAVRCYQFSAYLFGLAEIAYEAGQCAIAVMLIHRAVDLYLQHCALARNFMMQTQQGLEYFNVNCTDRVSVLNSLDILERQGVLFPDPSRKNVLWMLNAERNRLSLTHAVYGIKRDIAARFLKDVEGIINQIEGSKRWAQTREAWFPLPALEPGVIFDVETSMHTYLREITLH